MFGRKKKNVEAPAKGDAPKKQSQLAVVKDAYKLVKKDSPLSVIWCLLVFALVLTFGVIIGNNLGHPNLCWIYHFTCGIPSRIFPIY